ncbi:hypothetical protein ACFWNL_38940 [Kitasatospora sp. NPDC058397]|uniref:hypothetical protein n=1 Tax=unclassified Kitasatospora TaxID=2633591 RepID=UPI00364EE9B4
MDVSGFVDRRTIESIVALLMPPAPDLREDWVTVPCEVYGAAENPIMIERACFAVQRRLDGGESPESISETFGDLDGPEHSADSPYRNAERIDREADAATAHRIIKLLAQSFPLTEAERAELPIR